MKTLEQLHDLNCPDVGLGCNANEPETVKRCPVFHAMEAVEKASLAQMLRELRSEGYMVGVHNDYMQAGKFQTFWLFTHRSRGTFLKGEGPTDEEAVKSVLEQVEEFAE